MALDLHRDPDTVTDGEFRMGLLSVLTRIAEALEESNKGQRLSRDFMDRALKFDTKPTESPKAKKNSPEPPKSRSYEDYREWDMREDGSTTWQVKIDGEWVAATALESRLFEKRLQERRGK